VTKKEKKKKKEKKDKKEDKKEKKEKKNIQNVNYMCTSPKHIAHPLNSTGTFTYSVIIKKYPALNESLNTQSSPTHGSNNIMSGPPTNRNPNMTGKMTTIGRALPRIVLAKIFVPGWVRKILYKRKARVPFNS